MNERHKKMISDFKEFHSGNHTTNHRERQIGAQTRALSGIKKMSVKKLSSQNR